MPAGTSHLQLYCRCCLTTALPAFVPAMNAARKITVRVPENLLRRAQQATGTGITPTIRKALELLAASGAYEAIRQLRGKVPRNLDLEELREDR